MSLRLPATLAIACALLSAAPATAATNVNVPPFKSVELRGGGEVIIRHGAVQRVTLVKGSTQFTSFDIREGDKLVINACNASCPHQYDLAIEIVSPAIEGVSISGGGAIASQGGFPRQGAIGAAIMGGGEIDIRDMTVDAVHAAVMGGGHIKTAPTKSLDAAITGGGKITYSGNPAVTSAVTGGGSVSRQ